MDRLKNNNKGGIKGQGFFQNDWTLYVFLKGYVKFHIF
jgi:hypothetical protein